MRAALVKYSGRRLNNHEAVWYDMPFRSTLEDYYNTGDICVYDSTLRLVKYSAGVALNIDEPVTDGVLERIRASCDFILLRGSNYIHEQMDWGHFLSWIEALDLPVLVIGVGAQAERERAIVLPTENRRVWQAIADRAPSIGVRGAFSAETLHRNGIHNIEIVGCPSLFRGLDRSLKLRHAPDGPRRVTFSLRREVGSTYALDPAAFQATQKRIIAKLALVSDLYLSCHGEPEEKAFFFRAPRHMDKARAELVAQGWFDEVTGRVLQDLYERRLFYVGAPGDYDVYAAQFDAALGYRVHAVLPAVAVGVPGVLFSYDTRSRELAETFDLPIYSPEEFERQTLGEALAPQRFDRFQALFPERYDRMKAFIEKNGVPTRM
ncbi:polysaccharide pyruvyl transferase family protein [Antarcticirhabdus aurantiaca]|uniref:Polysaccharide pyruvyl transferase family protein n=1 Tax=Antarcticirhabdus aurantiaca TaxID=2606717 RepID=A0ACD4NKU7_9HYPH|nr:polysaccharide pyruvyl transferase family protein [Antarcticirhabdus aurantiaca]WAJ27465.1 polysaccharide pyruvyl transferase family protein [Jeongeuplla avenae]